MSVLDKAKGLVTGTTKLVVLVAALLLAGAFLLLAPDWTLHQIGAVLSGIGHGAKAAAGWLAQFVHTHTN